MSLSPPSPSPSKSDLRRSESAPLLRGEARANRDLTYGAVDSGTNEDVTQSKSDVTPLPVKQILLLSLMRMSSPIAFSQIFPYINEMVEDLGVADDASQIGYYSGIVDSTFSFVQLFTCLRIGMLADQIGRKPILLMGLFGIVLSTFLFGLSKTFIWAVATRAVGGSLSGNAMIINSAVGDITDETNQTQAYVWIGLAFNIASIFGPAIGGSFAKPEITFPNSFGTIGLFREFPYLLPCVLTGLIGFVALICCALFFKETVSRRPVLKQVASFYSSQDVNSEVLSAKDLSAWQIALDPVLFSIFRAFFILNILNTAVSVVFTLFAYTPIQHGGLSRDPEEIGYAIAFSGVLAGTIEVVFLAALQRRFGALTLLRCMMAVWPITFLFFPLTHLIARLTMDVPDGHTHVETKQPASVAVWVAISVLLILQRVATMAFPVNLILTRNAVPSDKVLGTVFGMLQLTGCLGRSIGPAFISSLFAFSKEHDVLGGNLVWLVMIAISLLGIWATMMVRDGRSESQSEADASEQG